jgi:hypothetical protein
MYNLRDDLNVVYFFIKQNYKAKKILSVVVMVLISETTLQQHPHFPGGVTPIQCSFKHHGTVRSPIQHHLITLASYVPNDTIGNLF